jgi:hypothetical protein
MRKKVFKNAASKKTGLKAPARTTACTKSLQCTQVEHGFARAMFLFFYWDELEWLVTSVYHYPEHRT